MIFFLYHCTSPRSEFPIGVLVIVVMETLLPKVFRIDMEKEREKYQKELEENMAGEKKMKPQPLNFMILSFVAIIGIAVGSITIPLGGSFIISFVSATPASLLSIANFQKRFKKR